MLLFSLCSSSWDISFPYTSSRFCKDDYAILPRFTTPLPYFCVGLYIAFPDPRTVPLT